MPIVFPSEFANFCILQCLLSAHVGDIKGTARRFAAEPLFGHLDRLVGQCGADNGSSLHTGIQHEHRPGEVFIHQFVHVDSVVPIESSLRTGRGRVACVANCVVDHISQFLWRWLRLYSHAPSWPCTYRFCNAVPMHHASNIAGGSA